MNVLQCRITIELIQDTSTSAILLVFSTVHARYLLFSLLLFVVAVVVFVFYSSSVLFVVSFLPNNFQENILFVYTSKYSTSIVIGTMVASRIISVSSAVLTILALTVVTDPVPAVSAFVPSQLPTSANICSGRRVAAQQSCSNLVLSAHGQIRAAR